MPQYSLQVVGNWGASSPQLPGCRDRDKDRDRGWERLKDKVLGNFAARWHLPCCCARLVEKGKSAVPKPQAKPSPPHILEGGELRVKLRACNRQEGSHVSFAMASTLGADMASLPDGRVRSHSRRRHPEKPPPTFLWHLPKQDSSPQI
jgi:hypothetical protein